MFLFASFKKILLKGTCISKFGFSNEFKDNIINHKIYGLLNQVMVWLDGKGIGELPRDIWLKLGWLAYAIWYIWDFKYIRPYIRSKNDGHSLK
jgi:hypothetical protein